MKKELSCVVCVNQFPMKNVIMMHYKQVLIKNKNKNEKMEGEKLSLQVLAP